MPKQSGGILVYRRVSSKVEVLLVHPGGPFFARKDLGVWSIPKGEFEQGQSPLEVAKREFEEETGNIISSNDLFPLAPVKSKGGKIVYAWAVQQDFNEPFISSNTFDLEWPPKSGKKQIFPEADNAAFFPVQEAKKKIYPYQLPLLDELEKVLTECKQIP